MVRLWDRIRADGGVGLITAVGMAGFVLLVYVTVVVGGGALLGRTGSPSVWLSVLATAIVALAFEPVRARSGRTVARLTHHDRSSPYQVLARYPSTVAGFCPSDELPRRISRVLQEGTDTARSEVWLAVHGRLELAASWPPDSGVDGPRTPHPDGAGPAEVDGLRRTLAVRERGELLGALTVVLREGQQLTPVEDRMFGALAAQSALVLRVAGTREELSRRLADLEDRAGAVRASRRDLVARQDAERQRLERNIHDGAQQQVIALLVNLRLAQTLLRRSPERAQRLLCEQAEAARATVDTLTALSRGLYPPLLTAAGVEVALRAVAQLGPIPVRMTCTGMRRYPSLVEATAYFCCLEAVQNATKHSGAKVITIELLSQPDGVEFTVTDDGRGFTPGDPGGGLANLRNRIESVQGVLTVRSEPHHGTTVRATVPDLVPAADG